MPHKILSMTSSKFGTVLFIVKLLQIKKCSKYFKNQYFLTKMRHKVYFIIKTPSKHKTDLLWKIPDFSKNLIWDYHWAKFPAWTDKIDRMLGEKQ